MGDCSSMICYDISLFNWNSEGWTNQVLLDSPYLSSDEPQGALMTNGDQAWTWAEQLPYDPWVTGIALISPLNSTAIVVSEDLSGFSSDPTIVVPGDDVPMVAWLSPTNSVLIDRYPFTQPTLLIEDAFGPALTVDASGYTHLVAYGYDSNNSQQIWHTTNHPD
jgi:hypothetical protein